MEKAMHADHLVITIARNMGAGGSEIGQRMAARLGCRYLDRELLTEAAERLHHPEEDLESKDEHHLPLWETKTMLYSFGLPYVFSPPPPGLEIDDKRLFSVQKEVIREVVAKGPAVIVGRAAHWVLQDKPLLLSVFLHAPILKRAARLYRLQCLASEKEARILAEKSDVRRAEFSKWVTGDDWEDQTQYNLCINTWWLGLGSALDLIFDAAIRLLDSSPRDEEPF